MGRATSRRASASEIDDAVFSALKDIEGATHAEKYFKTADNNSKRKEGEEITE